MQINRRYPLCHLPGKGFSWSDRSFKNEFWLLRKADAAKGTWSDGPDHLCERSYWSRYINLQKCILMRKFKNILKLNISAV